MAYDFGQSYQIQRSWRNHFTGNVTIVKIGISIWFVDCLANWYLRRAFLCCLFAQIVNVTSWGLKQPSPNNLRKSNVFLLQLFLNVRATSLSMHRIETWTSRDRRQNVTTISKQDGIVFKAKQENNCREVLESTDVTPICRDGWKENIQMLKMAL